MKAMIEANEEFLESIFLVNQEIRAMRDQIRDLGRDLDKLDNRTVTITVKYVTVGDMPDPGNITRTINYVTGKGGDAPGGGGDAAAAARIRDTANALRDLGTAAGDTGAKLKTVGENAASASRAEAAFGQ